MNHLDSLKKGVKKTVSHFTNPRIANKLMAMGVLPGTTIQILRKSPFGSSFYVRADGLSIALRKEEAASIILQ